MRRDPDLLRALLFKLEAYPIETGEGVLFEEEDEELACEGFSMAQVAYHMDQLYRMGLIAPFGSQPVVGFSFRCIEPAGHDFLDAVRNPETWGKTKDAAKKAGGFTLEILKDAAKAIIRGELHKIGLAP